MEIERPSSNKMTKANEIIYLNIRDECENKLKVIVKEEFLRFCENTTIRGVPRIIKSSHRSLKYLWFVFFILYLIGFTICFIYLLNQYFSYDVIHPPRILTDEKAPFPSFTVCNLRPLSRNVEQILQQNKLKTPRQFAIAVNNFAIYQYMENKPKNVVGYKRASGLMGMGGYLASLSPDMFPFLGHKLKDFIIHCQMTYMDGSKPMFDECDKLGTWRRIMHPQYVNCYTLSLNSTLSNVTNTMELFLYLDEHINHTHCIDCFAQNVKSQLSGALILVHGQRTFPDFNKDIINLQPGTLTEMKLKIFRNINKLPPYGRCSHDTVLPQVLHRHFYIYSEELCKQATIQMNINRQCSCNAIEYPPVNSSLKYCSRVDLFTKMGYCQRRGKTRNIQLTKRCAEQLDESVRLMQCKAAVSRQYRSDTVSSCQMPCSFYSYESDRSTSTWPARSWQLRWMHTRIGKALHNKSELYPYLEAAKSESTINSHNDSSVRLKVLRETRVLEEKLLAVMINRPNYNVHVVEEKEVLSLASFLSQAGGLFSMWIGLTLISFVEVVEMLVYCCYRINGRHQHLEQKQQLLKRHQHQQRNDMKDSSEAAYTGGPANVLENMTLNPESNRRRYSFGGDTTAEVAFIKYNHQSELV